MKLKQSIILSLKHLSVAYQSGLAVEDVSLTLTQGEYVALSGPNGAGKTTLLQAVLGLLPIKSGSVELFGMPQNKFILWSKIGYVPQRGQAFNRLMPATVSEVVRMGDRKAEAEAVDIVLEKLQIAHLKKRLVGSLSGGQQQRVLLARALFSQPELLLLDEPSVALDPKTRDSFFALLTQLNKEQGVTIVLVTHDTTQLGNIASRLLYIDRKLVFDGSFAQFCRSKHMTEYFGAAAQHALCRQHWGES